VTEGRQTSDMLTSYRVDCTQP